MIYKIYIDLLFLDAGTKVYDVTKDFVVPILTGLGVPLLVFLLTIGQDNFKKRDSIFKFRDFFYFKLRAVKSDAQGAIRKIEESRQDLSFDNTTCRLSHLPSTNSQRLSEIPFLSIVDSFHKEFTNDHGFEQSINELTNSLDFVSAIPQHSKDLLFNYNDTIISNTNDTTLLFRDINNYNANKLLEMKSMTDEQRDYWTIIDSTVEDFRQKGGTKNSEDLECFEKLREIVVREKIRNVDQNFLRIVDKVIDNYQTIESSVQELMHQFDTYLEAYNSLLDNIDNILPTIRDKKPNRLNPRNYF